MPTQVVKRFVRTFPEGGRALYSVRRRSDGLYQAYHDNPYEGINQPYQFDDEAISGLFEDIPSAEAELLRLQPGVVPEP
jgi:hypothetical protein